VNGPGGGLLERWFNSGEKWAWEDDLSDQWLKGQEAWDAVIDEDDAICLRQARERAQPVTPFAASGIDCGRSPVAVATPHRAAGETGGG